MAFDSFSIKRIAENSIVDTDEVDKLVREKFSLRDNERDEPYGHFYFTESKEELGGFQKSISWAGLIHTIIYYSNIGYGYRDVYEILGALYETKNGPGSQGLLIKWPASAFEFTVKLIQFLKNNGLYVYVDYDDSSPNDFCENLSHSKSILKSESGLFECDANGRLLNFYPDINNIVDPSDVNGLQIIKHYSPSVRTLLIPEGVVSLPPNFFRGGFIQDSVVFPKSLTMLGSEFASDVFAQASVPDITIPETVSSIGRNAFASSNIRSLYIPKMFNYDNTNQFGNAMIGQLILPKRSYKEKLFDNKKKPYNYFYYYFSNICSVKDVEYV